MKLRSDALEPLDDVRDKVDPLELFDNVRDTGVPSSARVVAVGVPTAKLRACTGVRGGLGGGLTFVFNSLVKMARTAA